MFHRNSSPKNVHVQPHLTGKGRSGTYLSGFGQDSNRMNQDVGFEVGGVEKEGDQERRLLDIHVRWT